LHAHFEDFEVKMNTLSYKTVYVKKEGVTKAWLVVDAEGMVLGRLASQVASLIRGKHKPYYTPSIDCGDHVIVINADKVRLTGKKMADKDYQWYSGYPSGQHHLTAREMKDRSPEKMIEWAVRRMLPKTILGNDMYRNLHVYAGAEHPHTAQSPQSITLKYN
jgi:large subunit ribosomal protein L13